LIERRQKLGESCPRIMASGSHCLRPARRPITAALTGYLESWLAATGDVGSKLWVDCVYDILGGITSLCVRTPWVSGASFRGV